MATVPHCDWLRTLYGLILSFALLLGPAFACLYERTRLGRKLDRRGHGITKTMHMRVQYIVVCCAACPVARGPQVTHALWIDAVAGAGL